MPPLRSTTPRPNAPRERIALLALLVIIGLAIADFAKDSHVDKFMLGALLVVALGATGRGGDALLARLFGSTPLPPEPPPPLPPSQEPPA